MKKSSAVILCVILALSCAFSFAENVQKEDYTVVTVNGAFNIRGITPEGYRLEDTQSVDTDKWALFSSEDASKPTFSLVISFLEEYATVERLNDLSEAEMYALVNEDPSLNEKIDIMETEYGTKVMILRSDDPSYDFACFVTLYKGYEVGLNLFGANNGTEPLTDEQIARAMKFLSDLDFVPIESVQ